jgi:hypothetical protein
MKHPSRGCAREASRTLEEITDYGDMIPITHFSRPLAAFCRVASALKRQRRCELSVPRKLLARAGAKRRNRMLKESHA